MQFSKPKLFTCLTPALLDQFDIAESIVVVIDVFRATSTIAAALHNGAEKVIPVDSVEGAIEIGLEIGGITAGERDGKVADGLQFGNSPLEYPAELIAGKTLVLTTTNGTRLLHLALKRGALHVITGSFANLNAVVDYLKQSNKPVLLACAGWKDKINMEDTMFAGALVKRLKDAFNITCDSSLLAEQVYKSAAQNFWEIITTASHYNRLSKYGLEEDMKWCITPNLANVLPIYKAGALHRLV